MVQINRVKYIVPNKLLLTLYYSMVYPYLNYCCIVWGGASITSISKLLILQKRSVRILSHSAYLAPSNPLFIKLSLLKFPDIYILRIAEFMYKFTYDLLPRSCNNFLAFENLSHEYYTRHSHILNPASCRTIIRFSYISVCGPKIWNKLPENIKRLPSLNVFKRNLTVYLLNNYLSNR